MTKEEENEIRRRLEKLESSPQLPSAPTNSEIERRLASLEKSASELDVRIFDSHKWFVTILFSAVAVMLSLFAYWSRLDVKDSTAAMEKRVEYKTAEMEKKVQALVGEALKKPDAQLLYNGLPLENQRVEVIPTMGLNVSPLELLLNSIFVKNVGDRRTEPLSVKLSIAGPFRLGYHVQDWEEGGSLDKEFSVSFYSKRVGITIAPGEAWNVHPLVFRTENQFNFQTNLPCKLQIFYGGERPAEARFHIKLKQ